MVLGNTLNILRPPDRSTPPVQTGWNEDLVKNLHNVLGEMSQQISAITGVSTASLTSFATKAALEAATVPLVVTSIQLTGYTADGDGGGALYKRVVAEPSHGFKVTSNDGAFWEGVPGERGINVDQLGADNTGVVSAVTAIEATADYTTTVGGPHTVSFTQGGKYLIDATIDMNLPERASVIASGATFECTHNGVSFDMNPNATASIPRAGTDDNVTKRDITWNGGEFVATNATKTLNVCFQTYFMRVMTFRDVFVKNFHTGFKFGAKDSYTFDTCATRDCTRHYWVPAEEVLFDKPNSGNDLISPAWKDCHMSITSSNEAGIYMENRSVSLSISGGSFNGQPTVAHVRLHDNTTKRTRGIDIKGVHFEQMNGKPAILFVAAGTTGFEGVTIEADFQSGNAGWTGIELDDCHGVFIRSHFRDDNAGTTEVGISVDSDSRGVTIDAVDGRFIGFSTDKEIVLEAAADRPNVTLLPQFIPMTGVLTGWVASLNATGTETLDMSAIVPGYGGLFDKLPPKAWALQLGIWDSGSSGAAVTAARVRIKQVTGSSDFSGIVAYVGGSPDNTRIYNNGVVEADENGDLFLHINSTGAAPDTMTIAIGVNGAWQ